MLTPTYHVFDLYQGHQDAASLPLDVRTELRDRGRIDSGRILTADRMQAHNTFDDPHAVRIAPFDDARYAGGVLCAPLPAMSVVALEIR